MLLTDAVVNSCVHNVHSNTQTTNLYVKMQNQYCNIYMQLGGNYAKLVPGPKQLLVLLVIVTYFKNGSFG